MGTDVLDGLTSAEISLVAGLGRDLASAAARRIQAEGIALLPRGALLIERALVVSMSAAIFASPDPRRDGDARRLEAARMIIQGGIDG